MSKKLIGAFMALAAFAAFAVMPAVSSASPELTHPTGTTMPAGKGCPESCIKATLATPTALLTNTTGTTLVTCTVASLTGEVTLNNGNSIQGKITTATYSGTGTGGTCTSGFGNITVTPQVSKENPWCLKTTSTTADTWSVTGGACPGEGRIKFILDSSTIGECEYESTAAGVEGTYTTDTAPEADAVLTVTESGFSRIRGGFLCPSSGHLTQGFTLETDSATTSPVYIS